MLKKLLSITLITFALFIGGHAMLDTSAEAKTKVELGNYGEDYRYFVVWNKSTGRFDENYWLAEVDQEATDRRGEILYHSSTFFYTFMQDKNGEWVYKRDECTGKGSWKRSSTYYKVSTSRLANDILYAIMHH